MPMEIISTKYYRAFLAVLTSSGGITVSHSIKTGRFSLSNNDKAFVHSYDILAVADTIRDILKNVRHEQTGR